jgi:PAS domain S-box-containing protein
VEISSQLITYKGKSARHVLINDITERKQIEQKLTESEERFRSIFENNLSVMILIDPDTGRIVDVNQAAENYYGWTRQQLQSMRIQDINILGEKVVPYIEQARNQKQLHFEFKHRRADGFVKDVEVFSSKIEIQGKEFLHSIIYDISVRKQTENLLKLLNRAIEQSPVSTIITDKNGDVVYINPKFTEITGYTPDEVLGKNPRFLKSGEHPADFYQEIWDTILTGKEWNGQFRNKKKNGELFWAKSIISPIVNDRGEIDYFVDVQEDVTEIKKLSDELLMARELAEENNRLKNAFLHNISHEIRTPVNAILGFSDFLNSPNITDEKRKQFTDIIKQSSHQLLSIIADIVNMATIETGQEKITEKKAYINTICKLVYEQYSKPALDKKLTLNYKVDENLNDSLILTDETKVTHILSNIVNNAVKFTLKGFVNYGCTLKDDVIEFYVKDSGIGIPENVHEEIYKPFRQADYKHTRKFGGNGLGLTIAKAYVELLGGKIWLHSEPGKGTEFYFTIPYKQVETKTQKLPETQDVDSYQGAQKRILIVEDEEYNNYLLDELLEDSNFDVLHAVNGSEAVDLCKLRNDIDLILMDIKMPVMNGYEATSLIREFNPTIPIIAQTAYTTDLDRKRAFECGFTDFISKPFKGSQLLQLINTYLTE